MQTSVESQERLTTEEQGPIRGIKIQGAHDAEQASMIHQGNREREEPPYKPMSIFDV
jgi:hypothetical protein